MNFKKAVLIVLVVVILSVIIFAVWISFKHPNQSSQKQNLAPSSTIATTTATTSTVSSLTITTSTSGLKTYRNDQWGFEFQYPEGWSFVPNTFYSPFSKFNLVGVSPEEKVPNPIVSSILINIVTPDFANRAILSMKNLNAHQSTTSVAGNRVAKYVYLFESYKLIDIILPNSSTTIIFEAEDQYNDALDKILSSFKLLK